METSKVQEHEHPLKLIDLQLQLQYEEEEEEDDDDDDEGGHSIAKDRFHGVTCWRCGEEIHIYHRYYYKCSSSCNNFSLHKFCAELPSRLEHPSHPHHTLILVPYSSSYMYYYFKCKLCKRGQHHGELSYQCSKCDFSIDLRCAVEVGKNVIHHPWHTHLLTCVIPKPILCECSACGKEHKGIFYQCTTCAGGFNIHSECAFSPKKLLIQDRTYGAFSHTHPLTISYSFPQIDQKAKHDPRCRLCGTEFFDTEDLWIYKCDKCLYYVHLHCTTSKRWWPTGSDKTIQNYKDVDYPRLLHLPFPDETYSIPKHFFYKESGPRMLTSNDEVSLQHISHEHPLILVNQEQKDEKTSPSNKINSCCFLSTKFHDPMKKTQLLCNGCLRPIMPSMPFYKCPQLICNFALHEWCTRLPKKIETHPDHPKHPLHIMYSNIPGCFFDVFSCAVCYLPCNGFAYCCFECKYYVDVCCGFIPKQITHKAHPNHLLSIVRKENNAYLCCICKRHYTESQISFHCNTCNIYIHPECAMLLAETIRHKYDKHTMHLSYLPIENHKSQYFCEICEEDLNPHASFYHCQDCVQSIHTTCAPSILKCETETYTMYHGGIHVFVNIKFGGIYNDNGHPHPLSFAQGIMLDGQCNICSQGFQYQLIFKCHKCKFAIHYNCCSM
ncbi:uncharacterized protein LOC111898883 [Lactuca sativa]|uniref:Phorbol-ester/DAG-type domain-containing protein n=1 Tax=Lactuca sativa TaxID=4236 RepID=A0A9R1X2Z1_LACSA|nr:uncharacterized protein LOC111898883 [Lactuca sativa]KAJ0194252.1 hypothetical protein LSAT_V11C800420810 [Lactuca sativa]